MSNYGPPNQTTPILAGPPTKKKTSPLVWLLVGCGGLIVIGVIAMIVGGLFVYHKAKQAGLDPELIEKKPALAAAKFLAATNPDVEIVSVDEGKGLITIKDKKSGKTVTVNFEDVQEGKVTFKEEGEEAVTVEAKQDGSSGSVEVKSPEGSLKIGGTKLEGLPDWLPPYPGADPQGSYSAQTGKGESKSFHFITKDAVEKVLGFYEEGLKKGGFRVNTNTLQQNGKVSSGMVTAEDDSKKRSAFINALASEQGTQVTVSIEVKN